MKMKMLQNINKLLIVYIASLMAYGTLFWVSGQIIHSLTAFVNLSRKLTIIFIFSNQIV